MRTLAEASAPLPSVYNGRTDHNHRAHHQRADQIVAFRKARFGHLRPFTCSLRRTFKRQLCMRQSTFALLPPKSGREQVEA
jgi:hypothetical protein